MKNIFIGILAGIFVGIIITFWLIARSMVTPEVPNRFWADDDAYEIPVDPHPDIVWRNY